MLVHRQSLDQEIASLRAATAAQEAPAWLPDSLFALITAVLLRLFGRLEDLVRLWQAGQLPAPQPRPVPQPRTAVRTRRSRSRSRSRTPRIRAPRLAAPGIRRAAQPRREARATSMPPGFTPPHPVTAARAPPRW